MLDLAKVKQFIDKHGGTEFPRVSFRRDPDARFTTLFGIDTTTPEVSPARMHLGTDRAQGRYGQVVAPFSGPYKIDFSTDYGTFIRLLVADDFEVRIAHLEPLTDVLKKANREIEEGDILARVSEVGLSTGPHTHTEIVSVNGRSAICEWLLDVKQLRHRPFNEDDFRRLSGNHLESLEADLARKAVSVVAPHWAVKWDRWTKKEQTYYDSRSLFNF